MKEKERYRNQQGCHYLKWVNPPGAPSKYRLGFRFGFLFVIGKEFLLLLVLHNITPFVLPTSCPLPRAPVLGLRGVRPDVSSSGQCI
ncbi:MAG: hypothetical protein QF536_10030 [Arenicellales bacterium]|nr:hypothetical protein [Arenicellales bacterium]